MDKIEGHSWEEFIQYATPTQLWNVCVTFRSEMVKSFFDFLGKNYVNGNQHVFFHADATHGNVIMQGDKPMFIDPDGYCSSPWDQFILKVHEQNAQWFNEYLYWAHRNDK